MHETSPPVVAAFDLDGTLTEGGSVFPWLRRIAGSVRTYSAVVRLLGPLTIGALRSGHWADNAKERLFVALLAERDEKQLRSVSREFATEHLTHNSRSVLIERLDWHRSEGHDVVLVSASPQLYVDVVAELLQADGALGTRLAVDPLGRVSGRYLGLNCRGTEKLRRLHEWIAQRNYSSAPTVYAYGNSRGDRRMLAGADHPFDAGKLGRFGALRHYPQVTPGQPT